MIPPSPGKATCPSSISREEVTGKDPCEVFMDEWREVQRSNPNNGPIWTGD